MKRLVVALLCLFCLLLVTNLVSATPELIIQNEDKQLQPGETLLATLSLTNPETEQFSKKINPEDIQFLEGRKSVFIEKDIIANEGTYYIYAYLTREGNFTLRINNILYKSSNEGGLKELTIEKNLTIIPTIVTFQEPKINETTNETYYENKTTTEIISIKPGFFYGTQTPKLTLENKGNSTLNLTYETSEVSLSPKQKISVFPTLQPTQSFFLFEVLTYKTFSVPIIYLSPEQINSQEDTTLQANPRYLHVNLIQGEEKTESIELLNFLEQNITDIEIVKNLPIAEIVNEDELEEIEAKTTENLTLKFNSDSSGYTEGEIIIKYKIDSQEFNLTIPVYAYILPTSSSQEDLQGLNEEGFSQVQQECESLGGSICSTSEICSGEETYIGAFCCLATCTSTESASQDGGGVAGWVWGVIIFLVLAGGAFLAYKKFKKTKPQQPEQKIKKSSEDYQKRITGGLTRV